LSSKDAPNLSERVNQRAFVSNIETYLAKSM
jgi:hypothetical protein